MSNIRAQMLEGDKVVLNFNGNLSEGMDQQKMCSELRQSYLKNNLKPAMIRVEENNNNLKRAMIRVEENNNNLKPAMTRIEEHNNNLKPALIKVEEYKNSRISVNEGAEFNYKITKQFIFTTEGYLCVKINEEIIKISNFNVIPKKILIKDDGVNREIVYKLTCILNNGEEYKTIVLFPNELNNFEWIKKHLGIKYYIFEDDKAYDHLSIFISEKFRNIKEEVEYIQVGWRFLVDRWVYLHGGGAIGLGDKRVKGSKDKTIEIDSNMNNYEALRKALTLIDMSNDNSKTLPLFLFLHLAVMKEVFIKAGVNPNFVLWIYGLTGSMKTSVSKVFFNLFNRSGEEEITATFKDTITAIEIKAFEYKDSVLLIDDFHPTTSSTEKREMERLASEIIRRYGDGISKSRSTKNLTRQKEFPPRGVCAITGEDKLGGESTIARYISIEVTQDDFISEKLLYHQNNPLILSTHMYNFIYWVAKNFESLKNNIAKQFSALRGKNLYVLKHKRFIEAFTIYNIVCDIFNEYCVNVGWLNLEAKEEKCSEWNNVIFNVIKAHEIAIIKEKPEIMYLTAIQELVASNKCKLMERGKSNLYKTKSIGYYDEEKYYLLNQLTYAEVKDFWKRSGIEFPISSEQVNKALDKLGVIETKMEGNKTRRTLKVSGCGNERFIVIDIEKMNIMLNNVN